MALVIVSLAPITALGSPLEVKILNDPAMSRSIAIPLETPMAIPRIFSTRAVGSGQKLPRPVSISATEHAAQAGEAANQRPARRSVIVSFNLVESFIVVGLI